ncbi:hypothetical protein D3C80_1447190 [compost metagenome]
MANVKRRQHLTCARHGITIDHGCYPAPKANTLEELGDTALYKNFNMAGGRRNLSARSAEEVIKPRTEGLMSGTIRAIGGKNVKACFSSHHRGHP